MSKLVLSIAGLLALGACAAPAVNVAQVHLVRGGAYGKGIFIVSPVTEGQCKVNVETDKGTKAVNCMSQYVVSCSVDFPVDQPFCQLVSEIGPDRRSAYPSKKR